VNGGDMGMGEGGERAGLTMHALAALRVVFGAARKEFEGDSPAQHGVLGEEDLAHSPRPERPQDPVVKDRFVFHGMDRTLAPV
jgi:hypothetical protein